MLKTYAYLGIGLGTNYLFNIFIARQLGAATFGTYSFALTVFNIVILLAMSSLDQTTVHYSAKLTRGSTSETTQLKSTIFSLALFTSTLGTLALALATCFISDAALAHTLRLFSACVIPFVMLALLLALLQAHHIVSNRLLIKYLVEPATKVAVGVALIGLGVTLSAPPIAMLLASITAIAVLMIWQRRYVVFKPTALHGDTIRLILQFCAPLIISNLFTIFASRADILIIGWRLPVESVALYAAALQTSAILAIVLQAAETVSSSRFADYISRNDQQALATEYQQATRWSIIAGLPIFIFLTCNANLIMGMFGKEFAEAGGVFQILCAAQLVNLATGPANPILIMGGKTRTVMRNDMVYSFSLVCAIYFGTVHYGILGAATGAALANILLNLTRSWWVYRHYACHPYTSYYIKLAVAAGVPIGIQVCIQPALGLYGLVFYPAVAVVLLLVLGPCQDDKKILSDHLHGLKQQWKKS